MKKDKALPITPKTIKQAHAASADAIKARLAEFSAILETGDDSRFWEEMVFCFFYGRLLGKNGDEVDRKGAAPTSERFAGTARERTVGNASVPEREVAIHRSFEGISAEGLRSKA